MTAGDSGRIVILGAGIAALSAALRLAPRPVLVISPEPLGQGASSAWAQGGIAAVGQLQLLQPFLGLGLAALLLGETVSWTMLLVTLGAVACVAGARKFAT